MPVGRAVRSSTHAYKSPGVDQQCRVTVTRQCAPTAARSAILFGHGTRKPNASEEAYIRRQPHMLSLQRKLVAMMQSAAKLN